MKHLLLMMLSLFLLSSCYAYELKLEDPIFDFKQERIKRILILPFEGDSTFTQQGKSLTTKTNQYFKSHLAELRAVEIVNLNQNSQIMTNYKAPLWNLSSSFVQSLRQKNNVDLIITGKLKFNRASSEYIKTTSEDSQTFSTQQVPYLDAELAIQFWDGHKGNLVLLQQTSYQSKHSKLEILTETIAQKLSQLITKRVKPYYSYK